MPGLFDHVRDETLRGTLEALYRAARAKGHPRVPRRPAVPLTQPCGDCGGRTRWDGVAWRCDACTCAGG